MNRIKALILGSAAFATVAMVSAPMAAAPDGAGPGRRPFAQGAHMRGGFAGGAPLITIALNHGMGSSKLVRLIGVQRRVDATKDNRRASLPGEGTDLVAAKRIAGVNPDAHDVARLHARNIERL